MASLKKGDTDTTETVSLPEDADYAILQQPLNAGVKNVKQILKCIKSGSREVKDIILNECNIIYECKVCQSLFRSLANFLYHKRGFCKKHLCEGMLLFETVEESESEIITVEPTEPSKVNDMAKPCNENDKVQIDDDLIIVDDIETDEQGTSDKGDTAAVPEEETLMEVGDPGVEDVVVDVETSDNDAEKADETKKDDDVVEPDVKQTATIDTSSKEDSPIDIKIIIPVVPSVKISGRRNVRKNPSKKFINGGKKVPDISEPNLVENKDVEKSSAIEKPPEEPKQIDNEAKCTENPKDDAKEVIPIILKPIAGNQNAVFQVVKKNPSDPCAVQKETSATSILCNNQDDKKKILIVLPNQNKTNIAASSTTLNSTLTIPKDIHLSRRKRLLNRTDCCVQTLKCMKCNTEFATMKTLYFHMMSVHSQKRMYFPCPYCKVLFVQMYGVTRHIIQVHGKTKEQITNKLRDSIRKGAIWRRVDSVEAKEAENQLLEKENDLKVTDIEDTDKKVDVKYVDSYRSDSKLLHSFVRVENNVILHHCSKCARVFSRKSSQVSHEKFCIMNSSPAKSEEDNGTLSSMNDSRPFRVTVQEEKKNPFEIRLSSRPKRGAEKQMHKDFVDSQTLKWRSANKVETSKPVPSANVPRKSPSKSHEKRIMSLLNLEKLLCLKCNRKFSSFSNLRRHAAIHIGWTRYRCKCCEYQSYNKSDCIHHIERMHTSVPKNDIEKHVIHLVSESLPRKTLLKPTKVIKSPSSDSGQSISKRKRKIVIKKLLTPEKKTQPAQKRKQSSEVKSPPKKTILAPSTEKSQKQRPVGKKNDKKPQSINYRSLTTSSPTTIILSKTISGSTVQITKNTAPIPIYNSLCSSNNTNKAVSTRLSPRKTEPSIQLLQNINIAGQPTTASLDPKTNVVKIRIPYQVATQLNSEKIELSGDGRPSKKGRPISDWFIKKEHDSTNETTNRRDSAPVIIDLVRASSSVVSRPKTLTSPK